MKRSIVIGAIVAIAAASSACGGPAGPSASLKAGRYSLSFSSGSIVTGAPPCDGLPAPKGYFMSVQIDADGTGFRAHGIDVNANATFDLRIQADGNALSGTVSGSLRDGSFSAFEPAIVTFAANADGSPARFVGSYSASARGGTGSIDGRPTIASPGPPPAAGACVPGQLKWALTGPVG